MTLPPGQVIERYTVEAEIGSGGLATVYRVRHNTLGNAHALKVLHVAGASLLDRLVLEGRVQAALRHPNVVSVTDVIEVVGAPALVMEFVEGPSLDAWLHQHRPTLAEAEALFVAILAGVAHAHRHGLIHRDLKPGNVLLQEVDGQLVPKVSDFGLVKILAGEDRDASHTRSNVGMGTPAYMSPEQMQDAKRVDHRTDVFALGCILYELVCGRRAFDGPSLLSIFNAAATGAYVPPLDIVPGLPPRVVHAITGALNPERDARFPDCAALRRALLAEDAAGTSGGAAGTSHGTAPGGIAGGAGAGAIAVGGLTPLGAIPRAPTFHPAVDRSTHAASSVPFPVDSAVSLAAAPAPARTPPPPGAPATGAATDPAPGARWALLGAAGALTVVGGVTALALAGWLAWRTFGGGPAEPPAEPAVATDPLVIPEVAEGTPIAPGPADPALPPMPTAAPATTTAASATPPVTSTRTRPDAPPEAAAPPATAASAAAQPAPAEPVAATVSGPLPADLSGGTEDAREEALSRYEADPAMTTAIVWVLQNDPAPAVRFKAWRVVRARWRRGTGSAEAHERAAVWLAEHGATKARVEAVAAIRERSRSLPNAAARLGDPDAGVRAAAVGAVVEVARRAGDAAAARRLLEARLAVESDGGVRSRIADALAEL